MKLRDKDFQELYQEANKLSNKKELTPMLKYGQVGTALMTGDGSVYTGISIKAPSGLGNCSEYAAIVTMLKDDKHDIKKMISVRNGEILPPCGRCRELVTQITHGDVQIAVDESTAVSIEDLLPYPWTFKNTEAKTRRS